MVEGEGQQHGFQVRQAALSQQRGQPAGRGHRHMPLQQLLRQLDVGAGGGAEPRLLLKELPAGQHFHRVVDGAAQLLLQAGENSSLASISTDNGGSGVSQGSKEAATSG